MEKRSFWKMSAILATFGLALALVFTSCGDDNGGGGSGALGANLNLSGRVYTLGWADDASAPTFTPFGGSRTVVSEPPGGEGGIVNGQLNFSFGRPATEHLQSVAHMFEDVAAFDDVRVAPAAARGTWMWLETMTGTSVNGSISRGHVTGTATSFTYRFVGYIFVDREVTISGSGITETFVCDCEEWDGECMCAEWDDACYCHGTFTSRSFNITLREGWNALHERWDYRLGANNVVSETLTLSHENPGSPLRWIFNDWTADGWSEDIELSGRALRGGTDARPSFRTRR